MFGGDLRGTARSKQCVGKFLAAVGFREPPRGGIDQSQTLHRGQVRLTLTQRRVPALSGLLPTLPGIPRIRLSPASIGPLRRPNGEDSHPSRPPGASWRTQQRSTATTPTNTVSMCPPTARDVPIQLVLDWLPEHAELTNLGVHRLRDLGDPSMFSGWCIRICRWSFLRCVRWTRCPTICPVS